MDTTWLLFIAAATAVALFGALAANRVRSASHRPVDVSEMRGEAGLVVFTSSDCADCTALMNLLRGRDVVVREVTYELEPAVFEEIGVAGVPLTVAVDAGGNTVGQIAGLPRSAALTRLIKKTKR